MAAAQSADQAVPVEVGPGEVGEIEVRSPSVMAGYLPDEETAAVLVDGWYRTGDMGYLDSEGWLRITDRAKEMIKVRGFQVAPAEIEACCTNTLPSLTALCSGYLTRHTVRRSSPPCHAARPWKTTT